MASLEEQFDLMQQMNTLLINFKKDGPDRNTPDKIKRKIEALDDYWTRFEAGHAVVSQWEDQTHAYFKENKYKLTKDFYNSTRDILMSQYTQQGHKAPVVHPAKLIIDPAGSTSRPATPKSDQQQPFQQQPSQQQQQQWEEMQRKQASNFKAFTRTIDSIVISELYEKWEFEDALRSLQARWTAIDTLHWEIDSQQCKKDPAYEMEYTLQEKFFNNMKKKLNSKMWSLTHKEKSTPKMEIPTFNGSYQQWVSFKDLFTEAIHTNASLSDAQKMQYLKGKLKGEAEKLVQHLNICSSNYEASWEILNSRYNNKRLIFTSHLNTLLSIPAAQHPSAESIKKIHDTARECIFAIRNLGVDVSTWGPILVHLISQKLDANTHHDYLEFVRAPRDLPVLSEFMDFLELKFTSLESSRRKQDGAKSKDSTASQQQESAHMASNKKFHSFKAFSAKQNTNSKSKTNDCEITNKCEHCQSEHKLFMCKAFLELQPDARRKAVAKYNLCQNCLFQHKNKECRSEKRCRVCMGSHNTLLHDAFPHASAGTSKQQNNTAENKKSSNNSHVSQDDLSETLLSTALIRVQAADKTLITLRALIDQGSQISLITEHAIQKLKLRRKSCKGAVFGIGAKESACKGIVNITCTARHTDYTFDTDVYVMRNLVNNLPNSTFQKPQWSFLENIQLADPEFYMSRPVDILLGADIYSTIIQEGIIRHKKSQPVAQQTRLGWILCGQVQTFQCNVVLNNVEDLQKFWSVEDIYEDANMSQEDIECLENYKNTTTRNEEGRYIVKYPFHENMKEKLGASKPMAAAQFRNLERKLSRQQNLAKAYRAFMEEYQSLNHMVECTSNKTPSCYLPHHGVERSESTTTALRVVFNASAKTSSGYTLNDLMMRGPNLQKDLMSLILRWRQYQYAFTADIEKMYRQILISEDQQHLQKILWRSSPEQLLREYQMTVVTYGMKASPFLAMMTLKQLAADEGHKYLSSCAADEGHKHLSSRAAVALQEEFYMDDLVSGSFTLSSAKQLQEDLIKLLHSGGFHLRKWSANKVELLDSINESHNEKAFDFKQSESSKTLGLQWLPERDVFTFQLKISMTTGKHTKRTLLSDISKIFDPIGWLSPITTKLKLLFKDVWLSNIQWDEELPPQLSSEWESIRTDLHQHFTQFRIPRWYNCSEGDTIELHGFCDASIKAYACVVYGKVQSKIILIAAKTRLIPANKELTLPRLELSGAHLLSRLMIKIQQALVGQHLRVFGWADSTAVLGWIQGDPNRWKPFVANRVKHINSVIPSNNWNYVKSEENPADCASRGITAEQLKEHALWWKGPHFLPAFSEQNAIEKPTYVTDQEIRPVKQSNVTTLPHCDDVIQRVMNKHSNWIRAVHVLAWVSRILLNKQYRAPYLTVTEIERAKHMIIKYYQRIEFSEEINDLQTNKRLHNKSKILSLNPFLDKDGILRVGGRIKHANISSDMKHPMIIPHASRLTELIIDHAHKSTLHGGPRLTASHIRQSYWIIGGNRAVKKRLLPCVICKRHSPRNMHQIMGDLPESRTNPSRPFYHTGVDYTGYVFVKMNKGRGAKTTKGYIAVFVCMATKAVHLELVSDMTSSAFLAALKRLSSRRGAPGHMYSDNGTNFIGANRELQQQFYKQAQDTEFLSELSDLGITWHFNAPLWPGGGGGLWESCVKSLKYHLRRVVGEARLTYEEYATLLSQIEGCLNSRPLCAISEDPDDINYLTPSHFLSSGPTLTILETEEDERTRWNRVRKIYEDIWKRWQVEYLSQLSARSKWKQPQANIKVDDVVLIHEDNIPAGKWLIGRVTELHPGSDGYVRVVTLKTKSGYFKRPIVKLTLLPTTSDSSTCLPDQQQSQKHAKPDTKPARSGKKQTNFVYTILSFIFFMTLATTAHSCCTITNIEKSLFFDQISSMQFVQDEWKIIAYYDMAPYWDGITSFDKFSKQLEGICEKVKRRTLCDIITLQLRHSYEELQYYNSMLMNPSSKSRRKRGLINGIGSIANSLFGVLDEQFAEQYQKDISLIRENQNHLSHLWKNQTSVIEAEHNLLQRTEETINKQHKIINQHLINLSKATNALSKELQDLEVMSELSISSTITNNLITKLRYIQDTLLETITDIHHGLFNIHLLTPEQLQRELNVISSLLKSDVTLPIKNLQQDLSSFYHLLRVKARVTKQFLIMEIKIPLVNRDPFELYKLIAIPKQLGNSSISVVPISEYVAINLRKNTYIPMREIDVHKCTQYKDKRLCHSYKPMHQLLSDNSLCYQDQMTKTCATSIQKCRNSWSELNTFNSYLFYCCGHCTWRIICDDHVSSVNVELAGVIALQPNCVIKGDDFTVFSHGNQESTMQAKVGLYVPDLVAPINHVINISIPQPDYMNISHNTIQMKEIEDKIAQMKSESAMIAGVSYHDVHHYSAIYGVIAALLVASGIYVWRRLRRRRVAAGARSRAEPPPPSQTPAATAVYAIPLATRAPRPQERPPHPPRPRGTASPLEERDDQHFRDFKFHPF